MTDMDDRGKREIPGAKVRDALAAAARRDPAELILELLKVSGLPLPPEGSKALTKAIANIEADRRRQPGFIPGKAEKGDNNSLDGTQLPSRPS